ncbi:Heterokaryon incompatibility [Moelleriella libera RCEF 2490]|uniref:Heterokaryon incompatibility n=1 Tax=Moelleriella libera RCEF 2490 TaxID=1081109 RepID=A0A166UNG6_9HYPO|nr:Heterokaryon incompatibility [Moelleriella libera RCEF 2490]
MERQQINTTCDHCINIFQDAASLLRSESLEASSTSLFYKKHQSRLAANVSSSKCHMCTLLHAQIPRLLESFSPGEVLALTISRARHEFHVATVGLIGFEKDAVERQTHYTGSLRIQHASQGRVRVLNSLRTWSLETLNSIRSWLKSCTSSHDGCAELKAGDKLPLRLVDVMSTGSAQFYPMEAIGPERFNLLSLENLHSVRIVPTAYSIPPKTPYLTLSHRWGNPPSILLNMKASFLLKDDIAPHLLNCDEAVVFRHAIHVTRALGFRYIWIDALCIMQDQESEKMAEIMRMDEIYFNSVLNISATEGRIYQGLICDREALHINPCTAMARISETQEDIQLQAFPQKWRLGPSEGPLNKRGWVFQERTLAPRIVHFTKDQVYWECHSLEASEVLPYGIPYHSSRYFNKSVGIISTSSSIQQVKLRWYELVEGYSRTSLSHPDDRLLAISAVAKRFCSTMHLMPSDYLAGMWKNDLPQSMLWSQDSLSGRSGPESTSIELEMKNAPSWSWASIIAPISTVEFSSLIVSTEVVCVQIIRLSPNFFAGSDSCRLRLRGPICSCRRNFREGAPWIQFGQHTSFQEFNDYEFQRGRAIMIYWDTSRQIATDEFFLLHIASEQSIDGTIERGVILRRTAERGTYVRVGTFFIPFKSDYPGSELEDAFNGRLDTLSADEYLTLGLEGKYTIDII